MQIPLAQATSEVKSKEADPTRLVNWYVETGGKTGIIIKPTPGFLLYNTLTPALGSGIRAEYTSSNNKFFVVAGNTLYELTDGSPVSRGTISSIAGKVVMVDNGNSNVGGAGNQLIISDSVNAWIYNLTTYALTIVSNYPGGYPTYQDGYFITNKPDTEYFYISAIFDGTSWSAIDRTTADGSPDVLFRIISNGRRLWLMGSRSTEVWWNSGNADFPFERVEGSESTIGTVSAESVAQIHNHVFWLGANGAGKGMVWMSEGYQAVPISSKAVEYSLSQMSNMADCKVFTYQQSGHVFFVMNFEDDGITWCYDLTENRWHNRMYWNAITGKEERIKADSHTFFDGKSYVGDYRSSIVYELSEDYYKDNTDEILRICETPNVHAERKRLFFKNLELDIERGVGVTGTASVLTGKITAIAGLDQIAGDGTIFLTELSIGDKITFVDDVGIAHTMEVKTVSNDLLIRTTTDVSSAVTAKDISLADTTGDMDPMIMMEYSNDGSHVYQGESWQSAGKKGHYKQRVEWHRLGSARSRGFRFKTSAAVNFTLLGLYADVEVGS